MIRSTLAIVTFGAQMAVALLQRPHLIGTAVRQGARMAPRAWWKSKPRLPVPRRDYMEFRQVTATGNSDGLPDIADVVVWLEWCRSMHSLPR